MPVERGMKRALFLFLMFAFPSAARADLDLVFLVDTTGSMGGEIREAKDTIKQMSESITASRKGEVVRIGVIAFRDKGDDYVTKVSPLSRSVDDSFKFLSTLR